MYSADLKRSMPWQLTAALLLVPVNGCGATDVASEFGNSQIAAAQTAKRPPPRPKTEERRPPRPKREPTPQSERPPRPDPEPPGSGDAIPVAAYDVGAGEPIGGLAGAVWADRNNDGHVDGYVVNDQYYSGSPQGYDPMLRRVITGAGTGANVGAVAGAAIPDLGALEGVVIGAAVRGLPGAVWADRDNDGRVDGYVYNGQYFPGAPPAVTITPAPMPLNSGERG